jgi:hypothetical protein
MMSHNEQTPMTVPETDLETMTFGTDEGEQAIRPITKVARLQWFNGLPTSEGQMAIGWHIEAGIHPLIDETMQGMGVLQYVVQHKRPDRDGQVKQLPYWALKSCSLIVITLGVYSPMQMRDPSERCGIAYGREVERDAAGQVKRYPNGTEKTHSVLRLRAFVHELVHHGYQDWLPLTLTGTMTDCLLEALGTQFRVLDAYAEYAHSQGRQDRAPFYGFSLPLVPSATAKLVGRPPQQAPIYPMLAQVPAVVDRAYLGEHLVSTEVLTRIRDGLMDETMLWSLEESARIVQGHERDEEAAAGAMSEPVPEADSSQDPVLTPQQLTWVVRQYCQERSERMRQVCQRFGVAQVEQLRASHFRTLVGEVRAADARQR